MPSTFIQLCLSKMFKVKCLFLKRLAYYKLKQETKRNTGFYFGICIDRLWWFHQGSGTLMTMLYKENTKTWDTHFLRIWAVNPHALDMLFPWALLYEKCPRSFLWLGLFLVILPSPKIESIHVHKLLCPSTL